MFPYVFLEYFEDFYTFINCPKSSLLAPLTLSISFFLFMSSWGVSSSIIQTDVDTSDFICFMTSIFCSISK